MITDENTTIFIRKWIKECLTLLSPPPPNVTGVLHMGHMLNNTIQDVLIRRARLMGKNACWVPGMDHASIATEAKVVAKLKEEGIDKNVLSREEFLNMLGNGNANTEVLSWNS